MSQNEVLLRVMDTLQKNIIAIAADSRSSMENLKAMQVQLSALQKIVSDMHLTPEPDAEGWIPRPTLR